MRSYDFSYERSQPPPRSPSRTPPRHQPRQRTIRRPRRKVGARRRLPIKGTLAETYLRARGVTYLDDLSALRFHPRCYYRADENAPVETWPAMLAAVTDLDGTITGVHRTWLARDGSGKAPVATPRRAMGRLLGNGVRFGLMNDVVAVGEGIETILALRCTLPRMPMIAALSASHLGALAQPPSLRRIYVAQDSDDAGRQATTTLTERAERAGVRPIALSPRSADVNDDLRRSGRDELATWVHVQLAPEDTIYALTASAR
ncbi:MAG: toprim domain-containing protein [Acetobacteraceae bacterium]|nr:toprim domain-containing protein [Acetobacteraceae bacterium]